MIFTGETLPDGKAADAVFIVPNPSHRDLLNQVEVRPLDYDYLTLLAPGPQRFYELLSFQMYGALASGRPRAKMLYSEYCAFAPQARYGNFEQVKKQMYTNPRRAPRIRLHRQGRVSAVPCRRRRPRLGDVLYARSQGRH